MKYKKGFTLIELLVVIAIIGLLSSVVLASLNSARVKARDVTIKSNLKNAISQGELFYNTNTANPNSYTSICTDGMVGGAKAIGAFVSAAAKASGLSTYTFNGGGTSITATCNSNANSWAAEVPLINIGTSGTGSIACNNATWTDPYIGFGKHCDYYNDSSSWVVCSPTEGGTCNYINATQIRYGAIGHYLYKDIAAIMWCVDSTGKLKQSASSIGIGTACL